MLEPVIERVRLVMDPGFLTSGTACGTVRRGSFPEPAFR
jgi:hypothetical protein